jgi:hypothetical protein
MFKAWPSRVAGEGGRDEGIASRAPERRGGYAAGFVNLDARATAFGPGEAQQVIDLAQHVVHVLAVADQVTIE